MTCPARGLRVWGASWGPSVLGLEAPMDNMPSEPLAGSSLAKDTSVDLQGEGRGPGCERGSATLQGTQMVLGWTVFLTPCDTLSY